MKIKEVISALERFAPLPLQEGFDNAGLQVGLTETELSGALLCLDVTPEVIDEAINKRCNLIVSHHPLVFRPLKRISDQNDVQRCVMKAIQQGITIVSMHTNMDNAQGGVNFKIAEKMGLQAPAFFAEKQVDGLTGGSGVIGQLPHPMAAASFINQLKDTFHVACLQTNLLPTRPISRVAVCGGAGGFLLDEAICAHADAFVTGEMHYHDFFGHQDQILICVMGHYQSEQFTAEVFCDIIQKACPGAACHLSQLNTNPILYH